MKGWQNIIGKTSNSFKEFIDSVSPQRALRRWGLSSPHLRCDGVGIQRAQKLTQPHTLGHMAAAALELQYLSAE